MSLKIHHLNCATFCPLGGRLVNGPPARLVCHCLLIESNQGLILVDTGIGLLDIKNPSRLRSAFRFFARPRFQESEAAINQIEALGYSAKDVRHIILTHLDFDHAGGLPEFPDAEVHVYNDEYAAAMARESRIERHRYYPANWKHNPKWNRYEANGENWFGFESVRGMKGLPPEVLMIPLPGHTRGHCAVAVETGAGWILHAGDAYFHRHEMDPQPRCTPGLQGFQTFMAADNGKRLHNQARLRSLRAEQSSVEVFCAHDPDELAGRLNAKISTPA
jgi:glyoxylase-like metal-dependent hydrolase (beta-lactamase superfamily II)